MGLRHVREGARYVREGMHVGSSLTPSIRVFERRLGMTGTVLGVLGMEIQLSKVGSMDKSEDVRDVKLVLGCQ